MPWDSLLTTHPALLSEERPVQSLEKLSVSQALARLSTVPVRYTCGILFSPHGIAVAIPEDTRSTQIHVFIESYVEGACNRAGRSRWVCFGNRSDSIARSCHAFALRVFVPSVCVCACVSVCVYIYIYIYIYISAHEWILFQFICCATLILCIATFVFSVPCRV